MCGSHAYLHSQFTQFRSRLPCVNENGIAHVADIPQWLYPRYSRAIAGLGASANEEQIHQACQRLLAAWSSEGRHHHDIRHVCSLLTRLGEIISQTHHPHHVVVAAFYHGAVFSTEAAQTYTRNGGENEEESADFAREELRALGIEADQVEAIASLISHLKHRGESEIGIDLATLQDAHLGSLAVDPRRYAKYLDDVAAEYSHIPTRDFLEARREIARRLLSRKHLFHSPLGQKWEEPARENLTAEIGRINKRLDTLDQPARDTERPVTLDDGHTRSLPAITDPVETSTMSSLESIPDMDGPRHHDAALEAKKQAERDDIARRMRERMSQRGQVAPESAPSAATPEWVDDDTDSTSTDGSDSSGMEKEPEM